MNRLFKAVLVRHNLVHRNGKMKNGGEHHLEIEDIEVLICETHERSEHLGGGAEKSNYNTRFNGGAEFFYNQVADAVTQELHLPTFST